MVIIYYHSKPRLLKSTLLKMCVLYLHRYLGTVASLYCTYIIVQLLVLYHRMHYVL